MCTRQRLRGRWALVGGRWGWGVSQHRGSEGLEGKTTEVQKAGSGDREAHPSEESCSFS